MPLVECSIGYAETQVAGNAYVFNRDKHGRFVALVENPGHLHCLLSVVHYRLVEDEPADQAPGAEEISHDSDGDVAGKSQRAEKPKRGGKKVKAGGITAAPEDPADVTGDGAAAGADQAPGAEAGE